MILLGIEKKLHKIRNYLKKKRVIVAFSGGADSTLLAKLAMDSAADAIAVTVDNGVLPKDCIAQASQVADKIGITHEVLRDNFLEDDSFRLNTSQRCYICKNKIYDIINNFRLIKNFDVIVDGTNISDLLEDRPGTMVNYQKNILTPLLYGGVNAEDVREALEILDIEYSKSTTCYATRILTGAEITLKKINRINYAETVLKNLTGLEVVRVRDDDNLARIEVSKLDRILDNNILSQISLELTSIGFKRVTLDITGYGEKDRDVVIYKPCRDEANKIMFEIELPYQIDIEETCLELEKLGQVKCSRQMGVAMMEVEGKNVTIFNKGKIIARRVDDQDDAQKLMVKILPLIRRVL